MVRLMLSLGMLAALALAMTVAKKVMEDALDCGASDFTADGDIFEINTEPDDFNAVTAALEAKGYVFAEAAIEMVPQKRWRTSGAVRLRLSVRASTMTATPLGP